MRMLVVVLTGRRLMSVNERKVIAVTLSRCRTFASLYTGTFLSLPRIYLTFERRQAGKLLCLS